MFNDEEHHTNEDEYFSTSTPLVGVFLGQRRLYMRFLWLGVSSLFPFNILIMTDPYFENKFNVENCTNTSTSTLSLSFENSVMLSCAVAYLLTTIVLTFVFTPYFHKYRIYTSLLGIIVCLMICFVFTFIDVQRWRDGFFLLFMIVVAIESIFNGILLNCVFSLASMLPSSFLQGSSILKQKHHYDNVINGTYFCNLFFSILVWSIVIRCFRVCVLDYRNFTFR